MSGDRAVRPAPESFARVFIEHGWRGIERSYGGCCYEHIAWIEASGGDDLRRQRAARQVTGRICGAR